MFRNLLITPRPIPFTNPIEVLSVGLSLLELLESWRPGNETWVGLLNVAGPPDLSPIFCCA